MATLSIYMASQMWIVTVFQVTDGLLLVRPAVCYQGRKVKGLDNCS